MWRKIKEILCKHAASKDETTRVSNNGTMTASAIDLRPSLARTEPLRHQFSSKLDACNLLNKTNEHCRSLFDLFPTSLRPRSHRQTSNKNDIDASTHRTSSIDIIGTDSMSQSLLNRTSSYASCYSAVATTKPIPSLTRGGSIENLLHGHSKSNPANIHVLIRKTFQPFAQAHVAVTKGTIVTALFSRGPWLFIRAGSNGKTGYIPRIICSLYHNPMKKNNPSISSTDSAFLNDTELDLTTMPHSTHTYKPAINRYLSHSSAIITDPKQRFVQNQFDTYTLPRPPRSRERRLTLTSLNHPGNEALPTRDTDSSSTQDSGYSDSTPFFLVHQLTPEQEQLTTYPIIYSSKTSIPATSHYVSHRRSSILEIPDSINPSQAHSILLNDTSKRHSFGVFETNMPSKTSVRRLPEFALIRNVRHEKSQTTQKTKPSITNLPKSHIQIPASIFLNHHRQKQQFGSSHSAFRPVQPMNKDKRASSEGHSPSISTTASSSSSNSSLDLVGTSLQSRRLSCDFSTSIISKFNSNSLTRSVCDPSSPSKKLSHFSRTMSDILCDQFSEINLDAIERDSLIHPPPRKQPLPEHNLFTIIKDYRSSRASFSVKRDDCVYVLKQVRRGCYLVRKHPNGQIGFLPKTLLAPATSTKVETFLEMHGYRETVI